MLISHFFFIVRPANVVRYLALKLMCPCLNVFVSSLTAKKEVNVKTVTREIVEDCAGNWS